VGAFDQWKTVEQAVEIRAGDILVLYADGVT